MCLSKTFETLNHKLWIVKLEAFGLDLESSVFCEVILPINTNALE